MEGRAAPMGSWGYGWRTAALAWVGLTIAAVAVLTVATFWYEVCSDADPTGAVDEPSIAEAASIAPVAAAWMVGIAQIVLLPLAVLVGVLAGLRFRRRRRRSVRAAPRPRGGSR